MLAPAVSPVAARQAAVRPVAEDLEYQVLLVGNTGAGTLQELAPTMRLLESRLSSAGTNSAVVFTGDLLPCCERAWRQHESQRVSWNAILRPVQLLYQRGDQDRTVRHRWDDSTGHARGHGILRRGTSLDRRRVFDSLARGVWWRTVVRHRRRDRPPCDKRLVRRRLHGAARSRLFFLARAAQARFEAALSEFKASFAYWDRHWMACMEGHGYSVR